MHFQSGDRIQLPMITGEMFLRMKRRNEAREWLDETGIVLAPTNIDDSHPQIEQQLEELGIDQVPSGKPDDDYGKRAA
jgi:hypothetical protein